MYDVNTLDRSDVDQAFRRRIEGPDKNLELPRVAIQRGKINTYDDLSEQVFGANEFYKEVDSTSLREARNTKFPLHFKGLDQQIWKSKDDEFDFTFLNYTDAHRIIKLEAYQMVGILGRASDYLTTPMQPNLYHYIESANGLEDWAYQSLYDGKELFLQGCHDIYPDKPIMGGIPPLELDYIEDLINLYEKYDVEAFYIDFDWQLPTRPNKIARLRYIMRRIANQRLHEDVLFYGINMRPGTYDEDVEHIPAADLAIVRMMVDIVGGNHSGPRIPADKEIDDREGFRKYDREIGAYRYVDEIDDLREVWPDDTGLDVDEVIQRSSQSKTHRNRYEALLNSEQMELDLITLRWCLDESLEDRFFAKKGAADEITTAGTAVRDAFEDGFQAEIGEYT